MKRGVKVRSEGIELPDRQVIKEIKEEGYKYLGVLEGANIKYKQMKERVREEYLRRVRLVAKSRLYAENLIHGINAWAVSVVHYSAGILAWTEKELKAIDVKTRKILAMHGAMHRNSCVVRLYMTRKEGGRGLISIQECVLLEKTSVEKYAHNSDEWMLKVVALQFDEPEETAREIKATLASRRKQVLLGKALHGKFFRQTLEGANERSLQWIKAGYLAKSTEAFLFAVTGASLEYKIETASVWKPGNQCYV